MLLAGIVHSPPVSDEWYPFLVWYYDCDLTFTLISAVLDTSCIPAFQMAWSCGQIAYNDCSFAFVNGLKQLFLSLTTCTLVQKYD